MSDFWFLPFALVPERLGVLGHFFNRATAAAASDDRDSCKNQQRGDDHARTNLFTQQERRQNERNQWLQVDVNCDCTRRNPRQRPRIQVVTNYRGNQHDVSDRKPDEGRNLFHRNLGETNDANRQRGQ